MKEKIVAYGRFDCKNELGYSELKAIIEYEDIMCHDEHGQFHKTCERSWGCYDVLEWPGNQKGLFYGSLQALIENSKQCYGAYKGFRLYDAPVEVTEV